MYCVNIAQEWNDSFIPNINTISKVISKSHTVLCKYT